MGEKSSGLFFGASCLMHFIISEEIKGIKQFIKALANIILPVAFGHLKGAVSTPAAIAATAAVTFAVSAIVSVAVRRIPFIGRWLCG